MRFAAAYFYGRGPVKNMRGGLLKFDVLFRTGAFPSIWMWVEVGWGLNLNCIYGLCTFHSAMDLYHYVKVDLICGVLIRLRNKSLPKYTLFSSTCSSDTANRKKKKKNKFRWVCCSLPCPVRSRQRHSEVGAEGGGPRRHHESRSAAAGSEGRGAARTRSTGWGCLTSEQECCWTNTPSRSARLLFFFFPPFGENKRRR